jgi:hypothetical protein
VPAVAGIHAGQAFFINGVEHVIAGSYSSLGKMLRFKAMRGPIQCKN